MTTTIRTKKFRSANEVIRELEPLAQAQALAMMLFDKPRGRHFRAEIAKVCEEAARDGWFTPEQLGENIRAMVARHIHASPASAWTDAD